MDDEIDDPTAIAILAAQVQDLDDLEDHHQTPDVLTDEHLALRLYRQELQRYATTLRDHRIGTLFGESPHTNHHLPELPLDGSPIFPTSTTLPRFLVETPPGTGRYPTFQSDSNLPTRFTVQDFATGPDGTNEERKSSVGREDKILSVNDKNLSSNLPAHLFGVPQESFTQAANGDGPNIVKTIMTRIHRKPEKWVYLTANSRNPSPSPVARLPA
ncbi:MAG: hypothetical protein L6R36_000315 [Xanthoria steineri]|nr:MAG: hypothetical protein L6R36_000315 [Xanthoria steineri]